MRLSVTPVLVGGVVVECLLQSSMNTLMEAMGIALEGNGTILALTKEREELYRKSARRVCEIALMEQEEREEIYYSDIYT